MFLCLYWFLWLRGIGDFLYTTSRLPNSQRNNMKHHTQAFSQFHDTIYHQGFSLIEPLQDFSFHMNFLNLIFDFCHIHFHDIHRILIPIILYTTSRLPHSQSNNMKHRAQHLDKSFFSQLHGAIYHQGFSLASNVNLHVMSCWIAISFHPVSPKIQQSSCCSCCSCWRGQILFSSLCQRLFPFRCLPVHHV